MPKSRRIIIAVSVPKGERFDWLIEKCTELGVERICPVIFERTVRQPGNPKALDRWMNLAISAGKQCKRLFLPQIDPPTNSQDCIEAIKKTAQTAGLSREAYQVIVPHWRGSRLVLMMLLH